jgi:hypothetical protein
MNAGDASLQRNNRNAPPGQRKTFVLAVPCGKEQRLVAMVSRP